MRQQGVSIECGSEVSSIERLSAAWRVASRDKVFEGRLLINAAGAWADTVAELAGLAPLGLVPHRRSAAIVEFETPPGDHLAMLGNHAQTWYVKPEGEWWLVSLAAPSED